MKVITKIKLGIRFLEHPVGFLKNIFRFWVLHKIMTQEKYLMYATHHTIILFSINYSRI